MALDETIGRYGNISQGVSDDPLFHLCWRRQSCASCLAGDIGCSWCPISSTCVPNSARLPILAPIGSSHICPLGSEERWELRTLPFGCNASSLTVISVVVSILGTFAAIAAGWGMLCLAKSMRRHWKAINDETVNDQGQGWSSSTLWNKLLFPLARTFGKVRQRGGQSLLVEEAQDNGETRPLIE